MSHGLQQLDGATNEANLKCLVQVTKPVFMRYCHLFHPLALEHSESTPALSLPARMSVDEVKLLGRKTEPAHGADLGTGPSKDSPLADETGETNAQTDGSPQLSERLFTLGQTSPHIDTASPRRRLALIPKPSEQPGQDENNDPRNLLLRPLRPRPVLNLKRKRDSWMEDHQTGREHVERPPLSARLLDSVTAGGGRRQQLRRSARLNTQQKGRG